jgi:hydrogenase maturation protease
VTAPVVIGAGNPLMGDDGFGLAVLERLRTGWDLPEGVELIDGGTWGMNLLPAIEDAGALIIVDAIDRGVPPGQDITLERNDLPMYLGLKLSPHQIDLREVLALAELRGTLPRRAVAIGVQPEVIGLGMTLSPRVAERVEAAATRVAWRLRRWGYPCRRLEAACTS